MFEALIEKILLSRLSGFIQDFDKNQLKISLWAGKITLEKVKLDPRILLKLKLPLLFSYTQIAKIEISIPWSSLSTKSVEIVIEGVYAILVPFDKEDWSYNIDSYIEKIKDYLQANELQWDIESEKKKMTDENIAKKTSYFENMKEKIIKNKKPAF